MKLWTNLSPVKNKKKHEPHKEKCVELLKARQRLEKDFEKDQISRVSDPVFFPGSGYGFQISLYPDPGFKFLWIRIPFQPPDPGAKKVQEGF